MKIIFPEQLETIISCYTDGGIGEVIRTFRGTHIIFFLLFLKEGAIDVVLDYNELHYCLSKGDQTVTEIRKRLHNLFSLKANKALKNKRAKIKRALRKAENAVI